MTEPTRPRLLTSPAPDVLENTQIGRYVAWLGRQRGLTFAGYHERTPILVGGDFNDLYGSLGRKFLRPAGFVRAGLPVNTYPAALPIRPLDALYVRGDLVVQRGFRSRMRLACEASDHLPLLADLKLPSQRAVLRSLPAPLLRG